MLLRNNSLVNLTYVVLFKSVIMKVPYNMLGSSCLPADARKCTVKLDSVTRFGKISSLWQNSASFCSIFKNLNKYLANFIPSLGNFYTGANCRCCQWPNVEK